MGWQEVVDESSGRSYYYNDETGETSWDPPPVSVGVGVGVPVSVSEWTQQWDESSGMFFYFNAATNETSWEPPPGFVSSESAAAAEESRTHTQTHTSMSTAAETLPEHWTAVSDPGTGSSYFYNTLTGETSWEAPPSDATQTQTQTHTHAQPVQWIEHMDPGSGKTFYEHPDTHETQWHSPYEEAAKESDKAESSKESSSIKNIKKSFESKKEPSKSPLPKEASASPSAKYPLKKVGSGSSSGKDDKSKEKEKDKIKEKEKEKEKEKTKEKGSDKGKEKEKASDATDAMSLYNSSALNLPSYSNTDEGLYEGSGGAMPGSPSHRNRRNGYAFAPDEFASEFISFGLGDSASFAGAERAQGFSDDEENQPTAVVHEIMRTLQENVDWTDVTSAAFLSEQLFAHIPETLWSSAKMLSALTRKLSSFAMVKFAENYFQFDRRGNQLLANTLDKLISFQAESLKSSLTSLTSALSLEAVTCFKEIQLFMSEAMKHQQTHLDIALNLIQKLILAPSEFHDEIYLQLMKQTKRNPSAESTELGWQLIIILLSSIPPSARLVPFFLYYCSQSVENLHEEAKKFAALSLKWCLKSARSEVRKELPTRKEIQAVLLGESVEVKVQVIDGTVLSLAVNSFTNVRTLETNIAEKLHIKAENHAIFALFEYREGQEKLLPVGDRVLDVISQWDKLARSQQLSNNSSSGSSPRNASQPQQQQQQQHTESLSQTYIDFEAAMGSRAFFLYKMHLCLPADLESDATTKRLLYRQAAEDVLSAHYPHTLQDALLLAALQLQILHGDCVLGKEVKELRSPALLRRLLSPAWLEQEQSTRSSTGSNNSSSSGSSGGGEIESRVLALYKRLAGVSRERAMTMFLSVVSAWKLFGGKYYLVKGQLDNTHTGHFAHDLVLAVTPRSVLLLDAQNKSFLAEYAYEQIYSWGHSFDAFVLVVGSKAAQVKSYFRTAQGKEIEELLKIYAHRSSSTAGETRDPLNSSLSSVTHQ